MLLELKKVFLNEGESLESSFDFPLDIELPSRRFPKPVSVYVLIKNHAGLVTFKADVVLELEFDCDRCGRAAEKTLEYHFEHILVLSLSEESGDDYIEVPEYNLEVEDLLRDDIILDFPTKLLCKRDCKGLCGRCGKNLNDGDCACQDNEVDPRLAVLKALLK